MYVWRVQRVVNLDCDDQEYDGKLGTINAFVAMFLFAFAIVCPETVFFGKGRLTNESRGS